MLEVTLIIASVVGAIIGLALGTLGGGGSILTVPALVYILGQDAHTAITSSLLIVGITSLIGLIPHAQQGRVRFGQGIVFGVLGIVGSFVGTRLSTIVPGHILLTAFAVLIFVVALLMLKRALQQPTANDQPAMERSSSFRSKPDILRTVIAATSVGVLTGFFGVGGGFILVPVLTLTLGFTMPVAVGTSLLVIAINSATALASRMGGNDWALDWPVIGTFIVAAVIGSLLGGRLAGRIPTRHLTIAFALLLITVAIYTGVQSFLFS